MKLESETDLSDQVSERKEAEQWNLKPCPCCKARPRVSFHDETVTIICSQWGCRHVEAKDFSDASDIWNQPRFSQGRS